MYYGQERYAIINNRMVEEGDAIAGAKVVKINKNNVVVKYGDSETKLNLNQ